MKALTIKEPWASLILSGKKTIETRIWKTKYRGLILLHASKLPESRLSGCIFAVVNLVDCKPMIKIDEEKACCEIYPKAYSWFLEDVRPTELKFIKGSLGLWNINVEIKEKLRGDETLYCLFG